LIAIVVAAIVVVSVMGVYFYLSRPLKEYSVSFEDGWDDWEAQGIDLNDPPVNWTIERTDDHSDDGDYSMKLYLNNMNDQGKIWVQRSFDMDPNRGYKVKLSFSFASSDFGSFNLWKIIAGAGPKEPSSMDELTFHGNTGNGYMEDVGYKWMDKEYTLNARSNSDGELYVYIGVWGTWETGRTYYIDDIDIAVSLM